MWRVRDDVEGQVRSGQGCLGRVSISLGSRERDRVGSGFEFG